MTTPTVEPDPSLLAATRLTELTLRLLEAQGDDVPLRLRDMFDRLPAAAGFEVGGLVRLVDGDRALVATDGLVLPGGPGDGDGDEDLVEALPWFAVQVRRGNAVVLPHLPDDLPREAETDVTRFRASGLRSLVALPLKAGGRTLGALVLGTRRGEPRLRAYLFSALGRVAAGLASALHRSLAEDQLRTAQALNHSLLVSLPASMAVIDSQGRLAETSTEWTSGRRCDACPRGLRAGRDFLRAWDKAPAEFRTAAADMPDGIRAVLAGNRPRFEMQLECAHGGLECRTRITVSPLHGRAGGAVVLETDGTELGRVTAELARSQREVHDLKDRLDADALYLKRGVHGGPGLQEIVGTSPTLGKVLHQVTQMAGADSPILILGETGTGKGVVARAIHDRSRRQAKPLIAVNCAALPESLIESELFGYEKGAFTGAVSRTLGRFEVAHGGSILLDEIGELPLGVQAKLLRVLEGGTFERLGSARPVQVNVRVLAATNRDLEKEVREGRFRADLYYRLNVFPIVVPPLRERREDVPLLVWHFINARQGPLGRKVTVVPDRLMKALQAYSWPGNIRELENVVERALILTRGLELEIDAAFLDADEGAPLGGTRLDDVQRSHIEFVLRQCGWKIAGRGNAAEQLGLKRATLQHRMKVLGIRRPDKESRAM